MLCVRASDKMADERSKSWTPGSSNHSNRHQLVTSSSNDVISDNGTEAAHHLTCQVRQARDNIYVMQQRHRASDIYNNINNNRFEWSGSRTYDVIDDSGVTSANMATLSLGDLDLGMYDTDSGFGSRPLHHSFDVGNKNAGRLDTAGNSLNRGKSFTVLGNLKFTIFKTLKYCNCKHQTVDW